jgi:hypothetical protein
MAIYRAIPVQYAIIAVLINEEGETIGRSGREFRPWDRRESGDFTHFDQFFQFSHNGITVTFTGVNANKISDKLTVSITVINGKDPKTAGERGYMSVSAEDFAARFPSDWDWR